MYLLDRLFVAIAVRNRVAARLCVRLGQLDQAFLRAFPRRSLDALVGEDLLFAGRQGRQCESLGRVLPAAKQERLGDLRYSASTLTNEAELTSSLMKK